MPIGEDMCCKKIFLAGACPFLTLSQPLQHWYDLEYDVKGLTIAVVIAIIPLVLSVAYQVCSLQSNLFCVFLA